VIFLKYIKILGIVLFTLFSFYYTDQMVNISVGKDPIMKEIKKVAKEEEIPAESATVFQDEVKAGKFGKKVNISKSYEKMKQLGQFNANFFVYDFLVPSEKISDHYDKYVVGGSSKKDEIALVFTTMDPEQIQKIQMLLEEKNGFGMFFFDGKWMEEEKDFLEQMKLEHPTFQIGNGGYKNQYQTADIGYTNSLIYRYSSKTKFYCLADEEKKNGALDVCKKSSLSTILPVYLPVQMSFSSFKDQLGGGKIYHFGGDIAVLENVLDYTFQKGYSVVSLDTLLFED